MGKLLQLAGIVLLLLVLPAGAFLAGVYFSPVFWKAIGGADLSVPLCISAPEVVNGDTVRCGYRTIDLDYDAPETQSFKKCSGQKRVVEPRDATAWLQSRIASIGPNETVIVEVAEQHRSFKKFRGVLKIAGKSIRDEIIAARLACAPTVQDWCGATYEEICATATGD
ncbi:MAG: hypothetical protein AAFQ35_05335 [Pseudomonadota bacterium]